MPWAALVVLSVLFRLPSLLNASATNSDAAICGIQAMHILRGEWSWFLYGSGYQTSADSVVAAAFFLVLGPTPFALMLSTLSGHVALTLFAFGVLRRRLSESKAFVLTLLLVFTAGPIHTYVLYPPRQAALTLVFAGIFFIDGAASRARPLAHLALGTAVATLSCFADPYGLLFLPGVVLLALLASADGAAPRAVRARRVAAVAGGGITGLVPYVLLRASPAATHGQTSLTLDVLAHNLELLRTSCLPWALGTTVYTPKHWSDYAPWDAPKPFVPLQWIGAASILLAIGSGAYFSVKKSIPWEIRRLGAFGALMLPVTIGGFLLSPMVMDHFSSRYLVAFLLTAPFAIAPLAHVLTRRHLWFLAPFLLSSAVSGWVSYKPFVDGPRIDLAPGRVESETEVRKLLLDRNVHFVVADYWASYRLSFLWREDPIVVPTNPSEDRYKPHRDAFEHAPEVAYLYDARRSRESLLGFEAELVAGKTPYEKSYERRVIGEFTVLFLKRKPN